VLFPLKGAILLPAQILWVNLITDGAPALALGVDPKDKDIMRRAPRPPNEKIFSGIMLKRIMLYGVVIAVGMLGVYYLYNPNFEMGAAAIKASTMALTTIVLFELINAFNCRSPRESIIGRNFIKNKWLLLAVGSSLVLQIAIIYIGPLSQMFKTVPLSLGDWALAGIVSTSIFFAGELFKAVERWKAKEG